MKNLEFLQSCSEEELIDFLTPRIGCSKLIMRLWLNQDSAIPNNMCAFNQGLPYPDNLLNEIFGGCDSLYVKFSNAQKSALDTAINNLTEREAWVLQHYFEHFYTLERIGEVLHLTRERIRQIILRAIRRLRAEMHLTRSCDGYESPMPTTEQKEYDSVLDIPINELGLSVRVNNCLYRASIRTVGDFLARSESEIRKIRNFGVKTYCEVRDKIDHILIASHAQEQIGGGK